jgi:hypothetical protein
MATVNNIMCEYCGELHILYGELCLSSKSSGSSDRTVKPARGDDKGKKVCN